MFTFSTTASRSIDADRARSQAGIRPLQRARCHGRPAEREPVRSSVERRHAARQASPRATCRSGASAREIVYRRRRRVVGVLAAVFVAVGIVAAHDVLAGPGGVPASASVGQPAPEVVVTARPGDTLWGIAERYHGEVSISRYVDALITLNGGASIEAGQAVRLP